MKTLLLDCASGIAGDMTVAALLDLGADWSGLQQILTNLLPECHFQLQTVQRQETLAKDFDVQLPTGHKHAHEVTEHEVSEGHDVPEEHPQEEHHHHHEHSHAAESRNLQDVLTLIQSSELSVQAKATAEKIFRIVAEAEATVHQKPLNEVHFHEVGAADSIADICGVAYCLDNLGIEKVLATPLAEGTGTVLCHHGRLPVPVPATKAITDRYQVPVYQTDNNGEMVTPTGAAIVAALAENFVSAADYPALQVGYGAGKRIFKQPNLLRAILIEKA